MWKHFGAPLSYIKDEIPWDLFYITLSVALDREERDRHFSYLIHGGDPKKWDWRSGDRAGTAGSTRVRRGFWDRVLQTFKGSGRGGRIGDIAEAQGIPKVVAVTVHIPDGREITKYLSPEDAAAVRSKGLHFNKAPEVSDMAKRVFMKGRGKG